MSSRIRHTFLEMLIDEKKFLGKLPIKLLGLHFIKPLLGFEQYSFKKIVKTVASKVQ